MFIKTMNRLRHQVQYKLNNNLRINYKYMRRTNQKDKYISMNRRIDGETTVEVNEFINDHLEDFFEHIIFLSFAELESKYERNKKKPN